MVDTKNKTILKAEHMYLKGMPIEDIAAKVGVSGRTVRNWKNRYEWDSETHKTNKRKVKESRKKTNDKPRKRGGQAGNINSVGNSGGGAPRGNKNSLKHGAYTNPCLESLDDTERALIGTIADNISNIETLFLHQIQVLTIRENRIMSAIKVYREMRSPLYMEKTIRREVKRQFKDDEEKELYEELIAERISTGERLPGHEYTIETVTGNKDDIILRLEKELSSVQRNKTKVIEDLQHHYEQRAIALREMELHPLRMELLDAQIESIDANTSRMLGDNLELEDTSEAHALIYGDGVENTKEDTEDQQA